MIGVRMNAALTIPVSGVGRLNIDSASRALERGEVDLVCFGRMLMAGSIRDGAEAGLSL